MCRWMLFKADGNAPLDQVLILPQRSMYSLALDPAMLPGAHFRQQSITSSNKEYRMFLEEMEAKLKLEEGKEDDEGEGEEEEGEQEGIRKSLAFIREIHRDLQGKGSDKNRPSLASSRKVAAKARRLSSVSCQGGDAKGAIEKEKSDESCCSIKDGENQQNGYIDSNPSGGSPNGNRHHRQQKHTSKKKNVRRHHHSQPRHVRSQPHPHNKRSSLYHLKGPSSPSSKHVPRAFTSQDSQLALKAREHSLEHIIVEELEPPPISNELGKRMSMPSRLSVVGEAVNALVRDGSSQRTCASGSQTNIMLPNADLLPHPTAHSSQILAGMVDRTDYDLSMSGDEEEIAEKKENGSVLSKQQSELTTSLSANGPKRVGDTCFRRKFSFWLVTMHMLRNHVQNLDGFGFSWYNSNDAILLNCTTGKANGGDDGNSNSNSKRDPKNSFVTVCPQVYRSVKPIHNDPHVRAMCQEHKGYIIFAHVRAATGTAVTDVNCHPFVFKHFSFMHNGGIRNFERVKDRLGTVIDPGLLQYRQGQTDSELAFFLFLHFLRRQPQDEGASPSDYLDHPFDKYELLGAVRKTILWIEECTIEYGASSLNFAVSDGETVVASRYRSSVIEPPPSLYYAKTRCSEHHSGGDSHQTLKKLSAPNGNYCNSDLIKNRGLLPHEHNELIRKKDMGGEEKRGSSYKVIIASEPYGDRSTEGKFYLIPKNSLILVDKHNKISLFPQFSYTVYTSFRRWRDRARHSLGTKQIVNK
eukprot:Nk52_evm150s226 gene=Nk52_evmTU150s226